MQEVDIFLKTKICCVEQFFYLKQKYAALALATKIIQKSRVTLLLYANAQLARILVSCLLLAIKACFIDQSYTTNL